MVAEAQNAYVDLLRGTTTDAYGDTADSMVPVIQGMPAILAETTQSVFDPATQMPRTVRQATCKVPSWAGVLSTDQIRDSLTGNVYAVIDVITPPVLTSLAMGGPPDTLLTLRRITAVAP